jgi:hypothetical protein
MTQGRHSTYTDEMADAICERLCDGESLRSICRDETMPHIATILRMIDRHEHFREQYTRALAVRAETMAEEILEIADNGTNDTYEDGDGNKRTDHDVIARSRLRVDSRKWLASKLLPKKYGDKITQEHTGANGGPIATTITLTPEDAYKKMLDGGE